MACFLKMLIVDRGSAPEEPLSSLRGAVCGFLIQHSMASIVRAGSLPQTPGLKEAAQGKAAHEQRR